MRLLKFRPERGVECAENRIVKAQKTKAVEAAYCLLNQGVIVPFVLVARPSVMLALEAL